MPYEHQSQGWLLLLLLTAAGVLPAAAQVEGETESAQLPALIKRAVARNPGLKAARLRWQAALERYPQATALPDPTVQYVYYDEHVETRVGPQESKVGVAQAFPFPGTLKAKGEVTLADIEIAQLTHERVLRDLIVEMKLSCFELAYLQRAIEITRENHKLMRHAVKLAEAQYAKEAATLNDVLKARAQAAQLEYDLVLLRELQAVETANVNAMLDRDVETAIGRVQTGELELVETDFGALERRALAQRQELQIAAGRVRRAGERVRLARRQNLPRFKLSATRIETGEALNPGLADSGKDPVMYGVSMSLPLNFRRNRAAVREARLRRAASEQARRALANETRALVRKLYFRLKNARRLIRLYEKSLIPQARQAMAQAEAWEVDARKSLAGFLETQSIWLNFNLARLRALTDYRQGVARLERVVGGALGGDAAAAGEEVDDATE